MCHVNRSIRLTHACCASLAQVPYNGSFPTTSIILGEEEDWYTDLVSDSQLAYGSFNTTFRCCDPDDPYFSWSRELRTPTCGEALQRKQQESGFLDACIQADDPNSFSYDERQYFLMPNASTHAQAKATCATRGAVLARYGHAPSSCIFWRVCARLSRGGRAFEP